jgi:hypothetical protein
MSPAMPAQPPGPPAHPLGGQKKPRPPPLSLELSYILDAAHPDVFRISNGQF